ncbi:MAG: glycoside hydrolase family 3 C-terminal domain-containing protein [Prevotella sp.]|nr:glycoside hydrolase family 3 C-terminal domain-containing protein [Prevotella sp.]
MKKKEMSKSLLSVVIIGLLISLTGCDGQKWSEQQVGSFMMVSQRGGPTLGYSPLSGVKLLTVDGFAFMDLNRNDSLDAYEDWRLTPQERAADLASQLLIEEIAGLMLYSSHQSVPMVSHMGFGASTYDGKSFEESGAKASDLSDDQKKFLRDDHLRAVLMTGVESPAIAAEWNNNMQAFVEGLDHGIPANTSSDPRHEAKATTEYNAGAGGQISLWPTSLGLAATFDPQLVYRFGEIASEEYRALGIATALSPQIDIATEPRWSRFSGTFGEDPQLSTDMARAYCDAFQTTLDVKGWGMKSVNAMVKHWYGYGAQEGGRDSHYASGKYAVYPGDNRLAHKRSFVEGAFHLKGGTEMASAVMPIYSILWNQDPSGENVGGSYSKWLIQQELRDEAKFEGVVCTDWGITKDMKVLDSPRGGKPWGMEAYNEAERHYKILQAGVDQFGGNNEIGPVLEAYEMWVKEHGEESARERFEQSARRLLLNVFRVGLFENPYLDPVETTKIVGKPEYMQAGYEAQLKSIVMLKNHANQVLPMKGKKKVYVPKRHFPAIPGAWGGISEEKTVEPIDLALVKKYFDVVEQPSEADFAICLIQEPSTGFGFSYDDVKKGGNGYLPFSLQYDDYTATDARAVSVAGGDPMEKTLNRSFRGKTVKAYNRDDMLLVAETKKAMGEKPVVVILETGRPVVLSEIEPFADAILVSFNVQHQALLDIISGQSEPSALLPMQMPADMKTVEEQLEDVPRDMRCYQDADGNVYDFAFGLNWKGVIKDSRVKKYK